MEFSIFEKVNNSIANKLRVTLLKTVKIKLFLAHATIQRLNCVVHNLNVKKTENLLRKLMHNFVVHSNESVCGKSGRLGLDQVMFYMDCVITLCIFFGVTLGSY